MSQLYRITAQTQSDLVAFYNIWHTARKWSVSIFSTLVPTWGPCSRAHIGVLVLQLRHVNIKLTNAQVDGLKNNDVKFVLCSIRSILHLTVRLFVCFCLRLRSMHPAVPHQSIRQIENTPFMHTVGFHCEQQNVLILRHDHLLIQYHNRLKGCQSFIHFLTYYLKFDVQ